jgi:hypothetical protein
MSVFDIATNLAKLDLGPKLLVISVFHGERVREVR